jgi:hypothetical protein
MNERSFLFILSQPEYFVKAEKSLASQMKSLSQNDRLKGQNEN